MFQNEIPAFVFFEGTFDVKLKFGAKYVFIDIENHLRIERIISEF